MLKISAFYLVKQKSFIPKKQYDLGRSHYQNKKALFTDPIFSDGLDSAYGWNKKQPKKHVQPCHFHCFL